MLSRESATGGRFIPNTAARRLLCLISQRPRQGDDDEDEESTLCGERKSESAARHPATVKILGIFVKSTTTAQYGGGIRGIQQELGGWDFPPRSNMNIVTN